MKPDPIAPAWPPLLATLSRGERTRRHAHHAMHFVLAAEGSIGFEVEGARPTRGAAGLLTAPDVEHAIEMAGNPVLIVFVDPESAVGEALLATLDGTHRTIGDEERRRLLRSRDPLAIMSGQGVEWTKNAVRVLGGRSLPARRRIHPRVRALLRHLAEHAPDERASLDALAAQVSLSPGRLMHAFTTSIGIPLRPYLSWLRAQRAAALIVSGTPLAEAAQTAGFADAAHMSRTFRRTFGVTPTELRRAFVASPFKTLFDARAKMVGDDDDDTNPRNPRDAARAPVARL